MKIKLSYNKYKMSKQLIYIAVDTDGTVLTANTSRELCEAYVMDYFGINPNKHYSTPAKFEGYTKIEYSEFEDDLDGFWIFIDSDSDKTRINLFNMIIDQPI
jgi:hypothetical protein